MKVILVIDDIVQLRSIEIVSSESKRNIRLPKKIYTNLANRILWFFIESNLKLSKVIMKDARAAAGSLNISFEIYS